MTQSRVLNFYLPSHKRDQIATGEGIYALIALAVTQAGWQVILRDEAEPVGGEGHHLIYNRAVSEPHCLCLRRCHMNPFWRIEFTNDRWDWDVAAKPFPGGRDAEWFPNRWRSRLFGDVPIRSDGHIFMPLQGKLTQHRHFQSQSPVQMIASTLAADPARQIIATLHPRETYSPQELDALSGFGDRFQLSTRPSIELLAGCDYVVTENSAMALSGFFAKKPAVLFARIDFHHIAGSVPHVGLRGAFESVRRPIAYAPYLHWFFKENAISAIDENAIPRIQARLRDHGWPI